MLHKTHSSISKAKRSEKEETKTRESFLCITKSWLALFMFCIQLSIELMISLWCASSNVNDLNAFCWSSSMNTREIHYKSLIELHFFCFWWISLWLDNRSIKRFKPWWQIWMEVFVDRQFRFDLDEKANIFENVLPIDKGFWDQLMDRNTSTRDKRLFRA